MNILAMLFGWLNDQLLKMKWLSELVRLLVEEVFGLSIGERIGGSIHFFIYDTMKIFILKHPLIPCTLQYIFQQVCAFQFQCISLILINYITLIKSGYSSLSVLNPQLFP